MNKKLGFKACIFDLDGVLVETAKYHYQAWEKLTTELGFVFTQEDNEHLKGISRVDSLKAILKIGKVELDDISFQNALDKKNRYYLELIENLDESEMLSGVKDFLKELQQADIKICLGSASKNGKPIINKLGIISFFDALVDGNDVENSKPHPEVFLKGSALVNLSPEEVIVFEDAYKGIEAANAAGCYAIGIGKQENLRNAKFVIPGFEGLTIDKLQSLIEDTQENS